MIHQVGDTIKFIDKSSNTHEVLEGFVVSHETFTIDLTGGGQITFGELYTVLVDGMNRYCFEDSIIEWESDPNDIKYYVK